MEIVPSVSDLTVVNRHWLMDCHKRQKRLSLKNYLVGDSIVPVDDVSDDEEIFNSQPHFQEAIVHKKDIPMKAAEGILSIS